MKTFINLCTLLMMCATCYGMYDFVKSNLDGSYAGIYQKKSELSILKPEREKPPAPPISISQKVNTPPPPPPAQPHPEISLEKFSRAPLEETVIEETMSLPPTPPAVSEPPTEVAAPAEVLEAPIEKE